MYGIFVNIKWFVDKTYNLKRLMQYFLDELTLKLSAY